MSSTLPDTPPGNRAASTARTRTAIVDAATELFSRRGFAAVSLRDVAEAAGFTHPAVRRHFASKDELLEAVVFGLDARVAALRPATLGTPDDMPAIARNNQAVDSYIALTTGLAGAATRPDHPANARYRLRYHDLRQRLTGLIMHPFDASVEGAARAEGTATRLIAAWDGLQIISLAIPGLFDIPEMLERRVALMRGMSDCPKLDLSALGEVPDTPGPPVDAEAAGYAPGRAQRIRIVDGASALFAHAGFHATSIQEIADDVGVSKSTLLHHFPTKITLLAAVLRQRDERSGSPGFTIPANDDDHLDLVAAGARSDAISQPGLIALYTVLSTEATSPTHPAHAYFAEHFRRSIRSFQSFISATYGDSVDAAFEALWFTALWDGLQLQWLFDDSVDVGGHLQDHLKELRRHAHE